MNAADALRGLATPSATEGEQRPRRGPHSRPCVSCGHDVEVRGGVAVDPWHRRGRCAVQAIAGDAHEQARAAAEHDALGVGSTIARFRF